MSQPSTYNRQSSFTLLAAENPDSPYTGADLDAEFNAVKVVLDQIETNLALIQRDDGALANSSVGIEQVSGDLNLEFTPPTAWATATDYSVFDTVFENNGFYKCEVAHTSGTFATDLAAGDWTLVASFSDLTLSDDAVTTAKIADDAVTAAKIASGAVTSGKLGASAVTVGKIAADAVTTSTIAADAVTAAKLADDAVVTANIVDANVTTAKIADDAVTTGKIIDAAVTLAKLATEVTDAIDAGGSIADGSLTYAKIQNVSATDRVLGRSTAGAGVVEEIACTSYGRAVIGAGSTAAQRTAIGLGSVENTADADKPLSTAAVAEFLLYQKWGLLSDVISDDSSNTISTGDVGVLRIMTASSNIAVDTDANQAVPVGAWGLVMNGGTGSVVFSAAAGATLKTPGGDRISDRWGIACWTKYAADSYTVQGLMTSA